MKLNLSKCEGFSTHRSGWAYAIRSLLPFHSDSGVFFDDFVERKFIWHRNKDNSFYNFPWIGVVHLPYHDRAEFDRRNSLGFLLSQPNFQKSLKYCLCLVTLSESLKNNLLHLNIPVVSVKHPTEIALTWSPESFFQNPSITQLGYWLRKIDRFPSYSKMISSYFPMKQYCLPGDVREYNQIWNYIMMSRGYDIEPPAPTRLSNDEFDQHLCRTLVWCELYATSANNGIIEPLIRNTPIVTNRLEAIIEYLGVDYPLYTDDIKLSEPKSMIDNIIKAHEYLKNKNKEDLTGEFFACDLINKIKNVL